MRILSLDSDGSYQRDLAAELEASGHQVDLLDSAAEALSCDATRPFDLVITEARAADSDALQFLLDLRTARGGELPPAILLTDVDDASLRQRCVEAGAVRVLRKSDGWPATTAEIYGVMAEIEPLPEAPPAALRSESRMGSRVFRGNLDTIDIVDIVQLLNLGRKTGTLVLSTGPGEGRMHFRDGEVVAATSADAEGPRAFAALLLLKSGTFRFEAGVPDVEANVHQPTSTLLLDALRLHDEEGRASHGGLGAVELAADPFGVVEDFDFEHRAEAQTLAPPEPHERPSWLYAGVTPADLDAGSKTEPPVELTPASWLPPVDSERQPASTEPLSLAPADLDISRPRLATSRQRRSGLRLSPQARRTAVLAGIASVVLLGSGSVIVFSGVLQGDTKADDKLDVRDLIREAAQNQARIDSLEQVIQRFSTSVGEGSAPSPEAVEQISLLQEEIAKVAAARDAVREEAARKRADAERRERATAESPAERAGETARRPDPRPAEAPPPAPEPPRDPPVRDSAISAAAAVPALDLAQAMFPPAPTPAREGAAPPPAAPTVPNYTLAEIRGAPQFVPVDSRPSARSSIRPQYPRALAERKIGGTVMLWVLVDASGNVHDVRTLRSSGWTELDKAATDALRRAAYNPARRGGVPVAAWAQQQVVFQLD